MEDDIVLLRYQLRVRLELILEKQVSGFGSFTDESLNHRMFFTHPKIFGDRKQLFVELNVDWQSGFFEQLCQTFAHVLHKYFLQFDSSFLLFLLFLFHDL